MTLRKKRTPSWENAVRIYSTSYILRIYTGEPIPICNQSQDTQECWGLYVWQEQLTKLNNLIPWLQCKTNQPLAVQFSASQLLDAMQAGMHKEPRKLIEMSGIPIDTDNWFSRRVCVGYNWLNKYVQHSPNLVSSCFAVSLTRFVQLSDWIIVS